MPRRHISVLCPPDGPLLGAAALVRPQGVFTALPLRWTTIQAHDGQWSLAPWHMDEIREVAEVAKRSALEKQLGVTFKDPALLRQALIHSSYLNENPDQAAQSNERLEFLGDAVLGLLVADDLFATYPESDEGMLTELRTQLVRGDTLAKAADRLQLGEALLLGRGEEAGGGRGRPTNLAHAYESLVGAIFLDRGLAATRRFVRRSLSPEFDLITDRTFPMDPKSRLQEISQSRYQSTPAYRLMQAEGPDHARRFTIEVMVDGHALGTGIGKSKQQAEKEAARKALESMEALPPGEQTGMSNACT